MMATVVDSDNDNDDDDDDDAIGSSEQSQQPKVTRQADRNGVLRRRLEHLNVLATTVS